MIQIKCTLDNASTEINGIEFVDVDGVMVSVPVEPEVADQFRGINGYELVPAEANSDDTGTSKDGNDGQGQAAADKTAAKPTRGK